MKRLLMIGACLGVANLASAQLALEDFESGTFPPAGWTVVDNVGNGNVWQTSSAFSHGNLAGSGECAAIDSDNYGSGSILVDSELITPSFSVPAAGYVLELGHYYDWIGTGEYADIDISAGGGAWTNLAHFTGDNGGALSYSMDAYVGMNAQVRFHYFDNALWAWYWHVDDVKVDTATPPPPSLWFEDFESGTFPPAGFTVVDNVGNGNVWQTSSYWTHGNLAGAGECAAIDSDNVGSGSILVDTELLTPSAVIPGAGCTFEYDHFYNMIGTGEYGDVDVSAGGGAWTSLAHYVADASGHDVWNLDAYIGQSVQFRYHYNDAALWAWYWHVDNAGILLPTGPGIGYCFGDGSGTQCPCGNNNDGTVPGSGCANGAFASGALLVGSGVASLSADTLVLSATGLDPSNSGLYFQANNDLSPGLVWGDGLQCAGGQLKRLGVRFADPTGASDTSAWTTPISVKAGNVLAGDTKRYQLWYRDNSGGQPCGVGVNDFNATNGYAVTWLP